MNDDDNSITLTIREYGAIEYDREQLRSQLGAMTAERDEALDAFANAQKTLRKWEALFDEFAKALETTPTND